MTPTLNQRVDFTDASLVSLASHCLPRVASTRQENRTLSIPCQRNIPSWLPTALSTRLPFKPAFLGDLSRLWFIVPPPLWAAPMSIPKQPRPRHQCITNPPSTLIVCPVMCSARDEARNTIMSATDSGVCHRPSGTTCRTFAPAQSSYDFF